MLADVALGHIQDPAGIQLTAVGDRAVIAVAPAKGDTKGTTWVGVDPGMDAETSPVVWSTRLACPVAGQTSQVLAAPPLVLCRTEQDVFALRASDGSVVWRYHAAGKIEKLAVSGKRVAVREGERLLAVLALQTEGGVQGGQVLRRLDTLGAPLQAAMLTAAGPVALLVAKGADDAAAGHTHQIVAVPLADAASTADARLEPLQPAWKVAFGAADYALFPSQTAILAAPVPGTMQARDASTGRLLWLDPTTILPTVEPLPSGLAVAGIRPDGQRWVGLADPRTQVIRWRRVWELGGLHGIGEDNGHMVFLGDGGWLVARATDGALEGQGELADDEAIAAVQAADHVLTQLIFKRRSGLSWHQRTLTVGPLPEPLTQQPHVPWLSSGWRLVWMDLRHGGRDVATGLPGDGPLLGWSTEVTQHAEGWDVTTAPMRAGATDTGVKQTWSTELLRTASRVSLNPAAAGADSALTFALSAQQWQLLDQTGHVDLGVGVDASQTFHRQGLATVRMQVRDPKGNLRWTDLDTMMIATADGTTRLWLLAYQQQALVVRAELATRLWALAIAEPAVFAQPNGTGAHPTTQATRRGKAAKKAKRGR